MNIAVISRNVGTALIANAMFMFLSAVVSVLYGFDSGFSPLTLSAIITFLVGVFPLIFLKKQKDINVKEGLMILLLSWVLSCIFAMIPFVLWGGEFSLVNAWFESVSGITTTGATILNDIEALPPSLIFWRSATHYIGGLGVVVFIMMILPSIGTVRFKMSKMDIDDVSRSNYNFKSNKFIRVVVTVYIAITVAAFISLRIAGMSLFDSANHAMSVAATGGFSTRNASIASFNSPAIEIILMFFMIVASLHFGLLYSSFASRSFKIFRNPVTRFYLATILIASVLVSGNLILSADYSNVWNAVRYGFFEVISTISTTGFAIVDTNCWPLFAVMILLYSAIQCGCSGSTTSGIRSDRVWILFKAARVQLVKIAHPNAVVRVKSGNQVIDGDLISSVAMFVLIYIFLVFITSLVYAAMGFDLLSSISTSICMMSNVGPSFGEFGSSMSSFADAPALAKIVMSIQMIIGRLGLYSVLLIFVLFNKKNS